MFWNNLYWWIRKYINKTCIFSINSGSIGNTRLLTSCQNAGCSNEFIFSLTGRLCSGGKHFDWANLIFAAYFILTGRDTHTGYWFSGVIVSGQHDLPSYARAFSLTSFEMLNSSLRLNKGFRLFNFSKVLDLHNYRYKRFSFCLGMRWFPALCFVMLGPARFKRF